MFFVRFGLSCCSPTISYCMQGVLCVKKGLGFIVAILGHIHLGTGVRPLKMSGDLNVWALHFISNLQYVK